MFRIVILTAPGFIPEEQKALSVIGLSDYIQAVHLRKPDWDKDRMRKWLDRLPADLRPRIRLHDHFDLCREYGLQGVHLNGRNPIPPDIPGIGCSASCHTWQEVVDRKKQCDYVFLSPIFDSISKKNRPAGFSESELQQAARSRILDRQVFALGGIDAERIPFLKKTGFGGAGILGALWNDYEKNGDMEALRIRTENLLRLCQQ